MPLDYWPCTNTIRLPASPEEVYQRYLKNEAHKRQLNRC